jgi:uncharacterized Tic20 family protein
MMTIFSQTVSWIILVVGLVVKNKVDLAWKSAKLSSEIIKFDEANILNFEEDFTFLLLEFILLDDVLS